MYRTVGHYKHCRKEIIPNKCMIFKDFSFFVDTVKKMKQAMNLNRDRLLYHNRKALIVIKTDEFGEMYGDIICTAEHRYLDGRLELNQDEVFELDKWLGFLQDEIDFSSNEG